MRVIRAGYKDRDGQQQTAGKWYIDFHDHNRLRHKIPAFADKRMSEAYGRNIQALVDCRLSGLEPDVKLNQWIETLPDGLLRQFVSWGLLTSQRSEITRPLADHIGDYAKVLEAKGYSKDYVVRTENRLKKITGDCRFFFFRDVTQSAVEIYSGKLKKDGYSQTSRGHYLAALKTFLNWAETDRRIIRNPIAKMEKPARDSARKGILTAEQFVKLIQTTFEKNVLIGRTTGQERAVLYMLAGCTGLRRKELLNLGWDDICLSGENPYVRVKASIAKNDKEAKQPIPAFVVGLLEAVKAVTRPEPAARVFVSFGQGINTAGLIRADLKTAGIGLVDRDGNEICFHSLRNSYISYLANSQTPPKVVQKLARHADPRLTFNTYARSFAEAEQTAIGFLPNVGSFVLSNCLDISRQNADTFGDTQRHESGKNTVKTAIVCLKELPPRGLEPLSHG